MKRRYKHFMIAVVSRGLFLLWKSTNEIHEKLEGEDGEGSRRVTPKFVAIIVQIVLLDIGTHDEVYR